MGLSLKSTLLKYFNTKYFKLTDIIPLPNGGTGASTASGARTNLNVYSKSETDALVVGLLDDRGNYDASGNTFPASGGSGSAGAILKGDIWLISVAGTLGGDVVEIGDSVRALIDSPGQTASNWAIIQKNYGDIITNTIFSPKILEETLSGNRTLVRKEAQVFYFNPNGSNRDVIAWASPTVGDRIEINNTGNAGNNLVFKDSGGTQVGIAIPNGFGVVYTYKSTGWTV